MSMSQCPICQERSNPPVTPPPPSDQLLYVSNCLAHVQVAFKRVMLRKLQANQPTLPALTGLTGPKGRGHVHPNWLGGPYRSGRA